MSPGRTDLDYNQSTILMANKTSQTDDTHRKQNSSATEENDTEVGDEFLVALGNTWKAPDDLADRATVTNVVSETAEKHIIDTLYVEETVEETTLAESTYQSLVEETTNFDDRYDAQPADYTEDTVEVLTHGAPTQRCHRCDGDLEISCTKCSTGKITCSGCRGSGSVSCDCRNGKIRCDTCRGTGKVTQNDDRVQCTNCHGRGSWQCKECGGRGSYRCPTCAGSGKVTCGRCGGTQIISCPTCEAEGYVYAVMKGKLEFTAEQEIHGISDIGVPERKITAASGTRFDERTISFNPPALGERGKLRQTTEYRLVPAIKTTYTYDDAEYDLFDVDGSLHAPSYPKSTYRRIAPYLALLLIVLIGAGVYVFFL